MWPAHLRHRGGISIYEAAKHIQHPEHQTDPTGNYVVLALAMLFEGAAWSVAFREFHKAKGWLRYLWAVRESNDPSTFTVLFEDTAAMLGLVVAFLGVFLRHTLLLTWLDGLASVVIGVILCGVASLLAYESEGLLIGGDRRGDQSGHREVRGRRPRRGWCGRGHCTSALRTYYSHWRSPSVRVECGGRRCGGRPDG